MHTGPPVNAALTVGTAAHLVLQGNVFAGFGEIVDGVTPARRAELLAGNIAMRNPEGGR